MQGNSLLKGIILKALGDDELTPDERSMLDAWLTDEDNKRDFDRLKDNDHLHEMIAEYHDYDIEEGKEITQRKLQNRAKVIQLRNWLRYAAAIIILMLGSVFYFLIPQKHEDKITGQPAITKTNNDVLPGKYKAKLTLDDGSTIILDSAKNGTLVQQNGTSIINKDGKLIYEKGNETNKVLYNTLSTSKAQTYATVLSDGTKVWLNSESSIHYPVAFNEEVRKLEITGEAYFEVMPSVGKNGKRPFIVSASGMEIEVLGTHFNINSYADEQTIKTTLLEGKVKVHAAASNAQVILVPGEQAQLNTQSNVINKTKNVDVDAEVAWRFGYFQFVNADLKTVMHQLERWYDVEVVYQGEVSNDLQLIGKIPRGMNLTRVLDILQTQQVHFKVEGKKLIVTP